MHSGIKPAMHQSVLFYSSKPLHESADRANRIRADRYVSSIWESRCKHR